jgi:hypothetical protein
MVIDPTRSYKNRPYYEGPFKVLRRIKGGTYQLLDHDQTLYHRAVAPFQLKPVIRDPRSDPDSYVVERILQHKGPPTKRQNLVRWKNLRPEEDSWEPSAHFNDVQVIADYWNRVHTNLDPASPLGEGDVVLTSRSSPRLRATSQHALTI